MRRLMAVYARAEDLVRIGAYKPGTDPDLDRALRGRAEIRRFLEQGTGEDGGAALTLDQLASWRCEFKRPLRSGDAKTRSRGD